MSRSLTYFGCGVGVILACLTTASALQRAFRSYPGMEGMATETALPSDHQAKAELVLGRLMYPSTGGRGRGGDWTHGGTNWTVDYPKGDRTFSVALRRLTRVEVRSVEQPVNPDDGNDIFYWPYLHVGMPTAWNLSESQARKIREYLHLGGFLICDSFFGTQEWAGFEQGLRQIFPDRPIEDLPDDDPIFHTVYDLSVRHQVGNYRSLLRDGNPYRADGSVAHWRGVRDDKGRVVVMINFNSDLGDSWQLADEPRYPEKFSAMGIRLGVNYVVYAMTH